MTRFALFLCLLILASPARADTYAEPDFANLAHTLVRFNALDLNEDGLLDEYAMITDCGLYQHFYQDDFKWNQVRQAMRESVRINIATFPTAYHYDTPVQLDRYDFKHKAFAFKDSATIKGVNAFLLYNDDSYACGKKGLVLIPTTYRGYLDQPTTIGGLPIGPEDAEALLHRMDATHNTKHVIYARFHLRIVNIEPLHFQNKFDGKLHYSQDPKSGSTQVKMDMRLDDVSFYEDQDMTRLLYNYRP